MVVIHGVNGTTIKCDKSLSTEEEGKVMEYVSESIEFGYLGMSQNGIVVRRRKTNSNNFYASVNNKDGE
ncbi:MAG: hypothetical protein GOV02_02290 [Candidatus Aenigmarchaeota archaeon]|nr:hypothetical protein [Candidatus Aenigmarchaeota archaeon]